jgi:hypothetical protein
VADAGNIGTAGGDEPAPAGADAARQAPDAAIELLIRFARAGHDAGYATADLDALVKTGHEHFWGMLEAT